MKERVTTAIRFPPEIHEQLRRESAARDLPINYLVVKAVTEFLPRLVPIDEWRLTRPPAPWPPPPPTEAP